jgi:hypothetical protein
VEAPISSAAEADGLSYAHWCNFERTAKPISIAALVLCCPSRIDCDNVNQSDDWDGSNRQK